ncbi:MAG: aspartate carbamoyltransferase regulatory subunit [Oscillospiraceae bacterium]|jgi:aspartate carbamoyltransferase regulatory subunit|nr:aspartate carbamoyltransferase regulatory subunit [Oscillospiraceae bacterium]
MIIGQIKDGIVLDHITAGRGMDIYKILELDKLDCTVALIERAVSPKMGRKDIIKIDQAMDIDFDVLGYIDPGITVNTIRDGEVVERRQMALPERVVGVLKCKNPRCITSVEQELTQEFKLTDRKNQVYRCIYCDHKASK